MQVAPSSPLESTAALVYLALCAALLVFRKRSLLYSHSAFVTLGTRKRHLTSSWRAADVKVEFRQSVRPRVGRDAVIYFGRQRRGRDEAACRDLMEAFPQPRLVPAALPRLWRRAPARSLGKRERSSPMRWPSSTRPGASIRDVVAVVGRSLGSRRQPSASPKPPPVVARVVLVTPYDSIQEIAAARFSFFPVSVALARQVRVMAVRSRDHRADAPARRRARRRSFRARAR